MTHPLPRVNTPAPIVLAAGLALLFVFLCLRNTGLYPTIFSDETAYSTFSRLIPFSEATVPSYLYFALFRLTNSCGDGFLDCARLFNSLLFLGAAPFIHLIARRLMRPALACACALVSMAGPMNLYTLYFMPEASYFLCFWALSWSLLRYHDRPTLFGALLSGALLGVLTLVKMHGLFVIPALCLFLAWSSYSRRATGGSWMLDALGSLLPALATAAAVRFGLGYLLAGQSGLSLFGPLYRNQAHNSPISGQSIAQIAATTWGVLRGHLMGLVVLYGVPLAAVLAVVFVRPMRKAVSPQAAALLVYAALMVPSLMAVTVMFTVSVSGTGFDTAQRLHMRYYDFALPLLTLFAASQADTRVRVARRASMTIALLVSAALLYTAWRLKLDYTPQIADSPALHSLSMLPKFFPLFCVLGVASLLAWGYEQRRGTIVFLYVLLPIFAVGGAAALSRETHWAIYQDAWVSGARFTRAYLTPSALDKVTVVSSSVPGLYKAKFYLSSPGVGIHEVPDTEQFSLASYPDKKNWLLIVGKFKAPPELTAKCVEGNGFTLIKPQSARVPGTHTVDFSQPLADEGVIRDKGLASAEAFGRWTDAKHVEIEMDKPLPRKLGLALKLHAFAPNIGQPVIVTIGRQQQSFTAPPDTQTIKLEFETDGTQRIIQLTIPKPKSPLQAGIGEDARLLGLALHELDLRDNEVVAKP